MKPFDLLAFEVLYRQGKCVRTGRYGIRLAFLGDVFAEEWRSPEGATFWHETGHNPNPQVGNYEGFRETFPEECLMDLIGVDLPAADPELEFVEPVGNWDLPRYSDWEQTTYYTTGVRERPYPYNDVRYARCEKATRARGCNCAARYEPDAECICPEEFFVNSHRVWWLRRVRKPDGTPAWQECENVEF
jgi:hypothetical protein